MGAKCSMETLERTHILEDVFGHTCSTHKDEDHKAGYVVSGITGDKLEDHWVFGRKITQSVSETKNKITGEITVCYHLFKSRTPCQDGDRIGELVTTLKAFDHPNLCLLLEAFQSHRSVFLIYQHAQSCNILDYVQECQQMSELTVATIGRQLGKVVAACATQGLVHGMLVPRNIFVHTVTHEVRVSDLGLCGMMKHHPISQDQQYGTISYMAPELLTPYTEKCRQEAKRRGRTVHYVALEDDELRHPNTESDMWSVGAVLFLLLCGKPLFPKCHSVPCLAKKIVEVEPKLGPIQAASKEAKSALKQMLTKQVKARMNYEELLKHPWISDLHKVSDFPITATVIRNLTTISKETEFKKIIMLLVSKRLPSTATSQIREVFQAADTNCNGLLEASELNALLRSSPEGDSPATNFKTQDLERILAELDEDMNGFISMREFVAACLDSDDILSEKVLWDTFKLLDRNNDDRISLEEMELAVRELEDRLPGHRLDDLVAEVEAEMGHGLDFHEFCTLIHEEGTREQRNHWARCYKVHRACSSFVHAPAKKATH